MSGCPPRKSSGGRPTGSELVFLGESAAGMGLYLVAPDGSGPREIVHADSGTGLLPNDWAPDGGRLAFHQLVQIVPGVSVYRIRVLDMDTRREVVIASSGGDRNSAGFGRWSPDGRSIVFLDGGDDCACNWLSVAPSNGGPATRITPNHQAPYGIGYDWSPDGARIFTQPATGGRHHPDRPHGRLDGAARLALREPVVLAAAGALTRGVGTPRRARHTARTKPRPAPEGTGLDAVPVKESAETDASATRQGHLSRRLHRLP